MGDFKGITFSGQNVRPQDDGALYFAHNGDGILDGCAMSISGDDLVIQSGHFIMGGRVVHVDGATNVDLSGRGLTTGYIQVIMNADMSKAEGLQWYTSYVESATTTFPALTQDDINGSGTLYQLELAVVQISGGNLTGIYSEMRISDVIVRSSTATGSLRASMGSADTLLCTEGGNIVLRPNGVGDSTGQVFWNTDGQQIGGHPIEQKNLTSSTSITANTTKNLLSYTGLSVSGIYLASGLFVFNPSANTAAYCIASFNASASGLGNWRSMLYTNTTTPKYVHLTALYTGMTSIYFNVQCGVGGTADTASAFKLVRLG